MGRQIVYCEGCGHNLREDDFEKGRARMIDNRPFCTDCRPYQPGEVQSRRPSSGKVPAQSKKNSTGAIPIIGTPRRGTNATSAPKSNPTPVIAGVGGLILVALIITVTQGSSRKPVETVTAPPAPPPVVRKIDPVVPPALPPPPPPPPPVRVTPPPPTGPLVAPTASEKLDAFLGQIRTLIQSDPRFERSGEILNMFSAAAKTAGPRATEVAKRNRSSLEKCGALSPLGANGCGNRGSGVRRIQGRKDAGLGRGSRFGARRRSSRWAGN